METVFEDRKRKELEDRLKKSFPKRWKQFSEEERAELTETFYRLVWVDRISPQETLNVVRSKGLSFGMVFVGALLAIVVGLLVNIIHGFFSSQPEGFVYSFYVGGVIIGFVYLVWQLNHLFEESINDEYRDSRFLDELLIESKKVRNEIK